MKNTENTNNSFHNMWQFIEEYLPNYSSRDDVLQDDILFRYIDDDGVCDEDLLWIKTEFNGDKNLVRKELVKLETGFIAESINAYYMRGNLTFDTALGMTSAKEWDGHYDANGGYLVVKSDGDIVCYHFYNKNDIEDYLYNNTRFDRASRSRYNFGSLYRGEDGAVYMKLNLQIRFKK